MCGGVGGKESSALVCVLVRAAYVWCGVGRGGERRERGILHVFESECVRR